MKRPRSDLRSVAIRWGILLVCAPVVASSAVAQEPVDPRPYDGLQAGADAAAQHEIRRLAAIGMQIDTIEWLKASAGLPPSGSGIIYYHGGWLPGHRGDFNRQFTPWFPYLVGGVPYAAIAPQPIGRQEFQTGPNRWESHPVFAPPHVPPPATHLPPAPVPL
ncbi:MAG: hypothetical protein J5I93_16590, partial [Pirellulaceae bacterium]|nr:hypothetical protein [Pirellulaceae bacterium]